MSNKKKAACRSEDDWCSVFLLDPAFARFFHKMNRRGLVPEWWYYSVVDLTPEQVLGLV